MSDTSGHEKPPLTGGSNGDDESKTHLLNIGGLLLEQFKEPDQHKIRSAIFKVFELYGEKTRLDGTLSLNHKLRSGYHALLFETKDVDVVCAAFLHDFIEDGVEEGRFESDDEVRAFLTKNFGERVCRLVQAVSVKNTDHLSEEDAHEYYLDHFVQAIRDPSVFYVKLADFFDNGTNFFNIPKDRNGKREEQARKYLPIYRICIERLGKADITLGEEIKGALIKGLRDAEERAQKIVDGTEGEE